MLSAFRRPRQQESDELRRGRHADALAAAIEALGAGGDTRATLRALARASRAALDADRATVWLVDAGVGLARNAGDAGEDAPHIAMASEIRLDDPVVADLFSAGTLQIAQDESGDASRALARRFQARSLLAVPFLRGHEVAGAMLVTSDRAQRDWSAHDVTTLSALAVQAGLAIERASLAAETLRLGVEDSLTRLPNRTLFLDRLNQALVAADHRATPITVCVVNLDRFKDINDALGQSAGDAVLCAVAARLRGALRAHETVARLGGDEFGVLLPANQTAAALVAERLAAALNAPVSVDGQQVGVTASVGIAAYPDHGDSAETLLRRAGLAMAAARRAHTGFAVAVAEEDTPSSERFTLIACLRQALAGQAAEGGRLELHYQPKIDCQSGAALGAEALVRWHHPTLGLVSPARFIPLAEQTGLIRGLTRWALEEAIRQCHDWQATGWKLNVAVNLSAQDIQDEALPALIGGLLERYALPAQHLTVEVTESMLVQDPSKAMAVLARLHNMGVRASLDDFGTGYSSLAYLKHLPMYELKIDQSFVRDLVKDQRDQAIVASTIGLGHSLGMHVVAEGVEDESTLELLRKLGADVAQGYFVCRPQPADRFAAWIAARAIAELPL